MTADRGFFELVSFDVKDGAQTTTLRARQIIDLREHGFGFSALVRPGDTAVFTFMLRVS